MAMSIDRKCVRGVCCERTGPDMWHWIGLGGCVWYYELWGRKLRCGGEVVMEGVKSLDQAITCSIGYEAGVMDAVRHLRDRGDMRPDWKQPKSVLPFTSREVEGEG